MELKAGYKTTDAGVIPEDWVSDTVISVTPKNRPNGIVDGPFGSNLKTIHYRRTGIPIITSGYVTDGTFFAATYLFVDEEKFESEKRSAVRPGDIVMAKIGARCGASAILPPEHPIGILSGNALKITVDESRHVTYFIWQLLWTLYFWGHVEALRTVGAQPAISMSNLKKYKLPLPSRKEQIAIAASLSDADALIASLEALIAKKKDLKQAASQQLLTGKTRLPGFTGEWEMKRLGEIGKFLKGSGVRRDEALSGNLPCVRYGEIYTVHQNVIRKFSSHISHSVAEAATRIQFRDLLFAGSGETKEEIGKCVALADDVEAYAGGDIVILRASAGSPVFLGYLMNTPGVVRQKANRGQGDAVVHISAAALASIEIVLPDEPEQEAVAAVLTDMDTELATLEAQRDKARALKQGMMQELLAGRIRLV